MCTRGAYPKKKNAACRQPPRNLRRHRHAQRSLCGRRTAAAHEREAGEVGSVHPGSDALEQLWRREILEDAAPAERRRPSGTRSNSA